MSSELIKKEANNITLKLVVSKEQFEEALTKAYNKTKGKFDIPGFRKGKAPRKVIETKYGVGVFYEEAFNFCFPAAYEEALDTFNINPVDRPEIDIEQMERGKDVVFTVVVEVMPEFSVENYKGIEVEKKEYNVQEEDIQKELEAMQQKNSRMVSVQDRPVRDKDMVIIDYKGSVDGDYFQGGTAEGHSLVIGSGQFIPGFEEQLIGAEVGDTVNVNVTFPEAYHAEELAGKAAIFEVKIHAIKEKDLPAIDDEFAKDVSEFDSLEELKGNIKSMLEETAKNKAEHELRNSVLGKVVASVELQLPNAVVEKQIDQMLKDFEYRLRSQGINLEYYYQMTGGNEEDLRNQIRVDAAERVKTQVVLDKISELEKVEAAEAEVQQEIEKIAAQYKMEAEKFRSNLREQELNYVKDSIITRKTIDLLVESAIIS